MYPVIVINWDTTEAGIRSDVESAVSVHPAHPLRSSFAFTSEVCGLRMNPSADADPQLFSISTDIVLSLIHI